MTSPLNLIYYIMEKHNMQVNKAGSQKYAGDSRKCETADTDFQTVPAVSIVIIL